MQGIDTWHNFFFAGSKQNLSSGFNMEVVLDPMQALSSKFFTKVMELHSFQISTTAQV